MKHNNSYLDTALITLGIAVEKTAELIADVTPRGVINTIIDTSPRDIYTTAEITAKALKSTYNKLAEEPNTTITIDMTGLIYLLAELEEDRKIAKLINHHTFT